MLQNAIHNYSLDSALWPPPGNVEEMELQISALKSRADICIYARQATALGLILHGTSDRPPHLKK